MTLSTMQNKRHFSTDLFLHAKSPRGITGNIKETRVEKRVGYRRHAVWGDLEPAI